MKGERNFPKKLTLSRLKKIPKARDSKQKWREEGEKGKAGQSAMDEIGRHPRPATRRSVSPVLTPVRVYALNIARLASIKRTVKYAFRA